MSKQKGYTLDEETLKQIEVIKKQIKTPYASQVVRQAIDHYFQHLQKESA